MRRFLFTLMVFLLTPLVGLAESPVPERRLVITQDVDFFGADLQNLFDTTYEACQKACLADTRCMAFTYNRKSSACFPKSEISERQPFDGAISAEVYLTNPRILKNSEERAAELDFLSSNDLRRAKGLAEEIGDLHNGGKHSVDDMLEYSLRRASDGDLVNAMRWTGAAVSKSDASDLWVDYALQNLAIKGNNSNKSLYAGRALNGAINAYLRAMNKPARVSALSVMAEALERNRRGRAMIPALRLAQSIQPRDDVAAMLDKAIGKYGFRISEHKVESDSATPRICVEFSEQLEKVGVDYTPFVKLPDQRLAVQSDDRQICVEGVEHGKRYSLTFREGLPAKNGETLAKDMDITMYVRDRSPSVRFPGRAYVLPRTADAGLPVETVNLNSVELVLHRVSDRNLLRTIQEGYFGRPLSYWEIGSFKSDIAEDVWTGTGEVQNELNRDMTTRLPMGEVIADLPAGIYSLTASVQGADPYDNPGATQWFVLSDLGVSTFSGADGLHVFVRSLADASVEEGLKVTLLSRANRILGEIETNAQGYARFDAGLTRGLAGASPALVVVEKGDEDIAFLSLKDPAFDLSDRGVEGRAPAGALDVFLATDRGAYRAGETIYATALARDGLAKAVEGLPLTAILHRPDGVEHARYLSTNDSAGGHVFEMPLSIAVQRGAWRLEIKSDVKAPPLADQLLLVEDFLPERIDFDLSLPETPISATDSPPLTVEARYLFGAPGADLKIEGQVTVRAKQELKAYPGYRFGRHDDRFSPRTDYFGDERTDEQGRATFALGMPDFTDPGKPLEATVLVQVAEGSGRPVERSLTRDLAPAAPMIGIKPLFEGVVAENSNAALEVIAINPDLKPAPMKVKWTVNKVRTRYQWYEQYGSWNWEPVTSRSRVASGEAMLGEAPLQVSAPVEWGRYELVVEKVGGDYLAASTDFHAGWYAPADASATPDTLELSLDQPGYKPGDTAQLRVVPRHSGVAVVSVMSNRLIAMKAVEVTEGENLIPLEVTDDWGAGAYVTASVIRPMDVTAGQNPARSLGLSYAKIDPGTRQLDVTIEAPPESQPRGPLNAMVKVEGISEGETAYVTVAAVDLGILNLTGFESPDPSEHYFGQRRLGMDIRDIYGRLIDGQNGAMGQIRSGGDAGPQMRTQSPPPTEDLVAYFTGPVQVGPDGKAQVEFDIPEFNGTVRIMAVAWSGSAVGQGEADVLVRDPVVLTASLPRFLAPGDQSRLLLEVVHADGPSGRMGLDISTDGLELGAASVPPGFDLGDKQKATFEIPLAAGEVGDYAIRIALTTPDGKQLVKELVLGVRANDPEVAVTQRFNLAKGGSFTLDENLFAEMRPGTGSAFITSGPLARLDAPGLLSALDRYPYGCTEQITSRAMPLLYFDSVAEALGLGSKPQVQKRINQAIGKVLTRQSGNGAFGLWYANPNEGDLWLDAYVTDFLSRARAKGHEVPDLAFRQALDNLRNRVNYAPDFDEGGGDVAYALMVLARDGAAAMGDLRYYSDVKADAFTTPMAAAQLGAALAFYGDQTRADRMFLRASNLMAARRGDEGWVWRADYGTNLRDAAGILALAAEAGSTAIDRVSLADRISGPGRTLSTQESVWSLMAAHAMLGDPDQSRLSVNGSPLTGPLVKAYQDQVNAQPMVIDNIADNGTDLTLTTFGVPKVAPEKGGYGFDISRRYYTTEGQPVEVDQVKAGERYVTVIEVKPFERAEARLMINDPLPAGFEIDNPNLLRSGELRGMDWLKPLEADHSEFRSDRFLAAVDWRSNKAFQLAYMVRAISPGAFHHPAASVEDMYRPKFRARTKTGRVIISE